MNLSINQTEWESNRYNEKRIHDDYKLSGEPIVTEEFFDKRGGNYS